MSSLKGIQHVAGRRPERPDPVDLLEGVGPGSSKVPPHTHHLQPYDTTAPTRCSRSRRAEGHAALLLALRTRTAAASVGEHPSAPAAQEGAGARGQTEGRGTGGQDRGTWDGEPGCLPSKDFQLSSREKTLLLLALSHRARGDHLATWQAQASQPIIFTSMASV